MEEAHAKTTKQDLFDLLPDEVFHDILSFLNIDDLFRLSSLSKRCRNLCLTCPSLTYDSEQIQNFDTDLSVVNNSFDRFLILRGYRKIKRLSLLWKSDDYEYDNYRALTWLLYSFRCEVEEIELKFSEEIDALPNAVFSCESLRSLSLDLCEETLKFPYSSCTFANLYYLHLKDAVIDDRFGEWISSSKTIKKICLHDVYGMENINIESSSLELFDIVVSHQDTVISNISISGERVESISVLWMFHDSSDKFLKFSTPNLKYFDWRGYFVSEITMSNLMHLEFVKLWLSAAPEHVSPIPCSLLGNSIASAKVLHIKGDTIKDLYEYGCLIGLPFDVEKLVLFVFEDEDLNKCFFPPAFVSFLTGVRNLKTLCIHGEKAEETRSFPPFQGYGHDMKFWECQNLTFVEQLERVRLHVFNGGDELELAKFVLRHAKNLKEMIITHFATLPSHANERLNQFKVMCNKMASITRAKVIFDPTKLSVEPPEE